MDAAQDRKRDDCRVVVGAKGAAAARAAWPDSPIVALVDQADPAEAVFARTAGADIVLPTSDLPVADQPTADAPTAVLPADWCDDKPGLAAAVSVAVSAAVSLAERRIGVRDASRKSSHDLGQALSAINLAAELAISEPSKNDRLLDQIRNQAQDAGLHAWRAGRAGRSSELSLCPVDLSALLHRIATAEPDVAVYDSSESAWVLGEVSQLEYLLEGLIQHGRQSATTQRIDVNVTADTNAERKVEITIRGAGRARSPVPEPEPEIEYGFMAISEIANDLGGQLQAHNLDRAGGTEHLIILLSLPLLPIDTGDEETGSTLAVSLDNMTIQTDILEGVLRHAPLSESLEAIVAAIEQRLPDTTCSVLLLDDRRCLSHGAGAGLPVAYRDEIDGVAIGFGQGSCGTAAFLGQPVIAADVATNQHWTKFKDVALQHDLRSCWSTPILAADGGAVLGTFAVYRSEIWEPDETATRLVSRFTHLAAIAIGHHRLFNALAESESRFRSAFEGATTGMALVAPDGLLLKVNPALCAMLGTNHLSLRGRNLLDLVEPGFRDQILDGWRELRPEPIELPIVNHAGSQHSSHLGDESLWVSLRSSLVSADNCEQQYFYLEIRDISASRRHAVERQAREAAEAANRAKTDFLALITHELRTPLNAILGFAQVMQLVDLDGLQRAESLDNILTAGQHLLDLINELLDLSLIEAGQLSTVIEDIDAESVIGEALQIVRPLAERRQIALHRGFAAKSLEPTATPETTEALQPTSTAVLRADRQCVRQVLINLLGNAVKFTPPGGQVRIASSIQADAVETVRIRVIDSGPGIPDDAIDELFQPFHRLRADAHPQAEGTGLGLSVSARLVEEMEGNIGVESTVGSGSCFWVDLPRAERRSG